MSWCMLVQRGPRVWSNWLLYSWFSHRIRFLYANHEMSWKNYYRSVGFSFENHVTALFVLRFYLSPHFHAFPLSLYSWYFLSFIEKLYTRPNCCHRETPFGGQGDCSKWFFKTLTAIFWSLVKIWVSLQISTFFVHRFISFLDIPTELIPKNPNNYIFPIYFTWEI